MAQGPRGGTGGVAAVGGQEAYVSSEYITPEILKKGGSGFLLKAA